MIYITRPNYESLIEQFIQTEDELLLHVWGIAGTGKTQLIKNCEFINNQKTLFLDFSQYQNLTEEGFIYKLANSFLTNEDIKAYEQITLERINQEVYFNKDYDRKHILEVSGNLEVHGDLILGDAHYYGDKDAKAKLEKKIEILTSEFKNLIEKYSQNHLIIFDRLENQVSELQLFQWLFNNLLKLKKNIKVITISRKKDGFKFDSGLAQIINVKSFQKEEAKQLINHFKIDSDKTIESLFRISRLHPLSLTLAIKAIKNNSTLANSTSWDNLSQKLVIDFLIKNILENESNQLIKNALIKLPIYRFFISDTFNFISEIPNESAPDILIHLQQYGFIEEVNNVFKFHDLLYELLNQYLKTYLGRNTYKNSHKEAYVKYIKSEVPEGYSLMYAIEPLYHIFKFSPVEAQPYFESICKPALDRRDRTISSIILNEIDFESIPNSPEKGWYLLRLGGFFREFGDYPKALHIFGEALKYTDTDPKLLASIQNNIGWVYLFHNPKENVNEAINLFTKSNEICFEHNYLNIVGMNYNNLGIAFERKNQYKISKDYYLKSLNITESEITRNPSVAGKSYRNLGLIHEEKKEFDQALEHYGKAVKLYGEFYDTQSIGETLYFISKILFNKTLFQESLNTCLESQKFLLDKKHGHYLSETHLLLIEIFLKTNSPEYLATPLFRLMETSAYVDWDYHQFTVSRFIKIMEFISINYSKEIALAIISIVLQEWQKNEYLTQIPLVKFMEENIVPELSELKYWVSKGSETYHIIESNCNAKKWINVATFGKSNLTDSLNLCKKCSTYMKKGK
ncbi:MAG: tetratricopeptide repeat protein [Candidatus Delongbacteria bacterium]|nr:tetratricopeptide repeat protein [Candidatus Delongbacteria bacterium]